MNLFVIVYGEIHLGKNLDILWFKSIPQNLVRIHILPDALAYSSSAGAACRFKQAVAGEEARRARARLAEVVQGWAVLM